MRTLGATAGVNYRAAPGPNAVTLINKASDYKRFDPAWRESEMDVPQIAATEAWFRTATQLQSPRWRSVHDELGVQLKALDKILNEGIEQKTAMTGGTDGTGGYGVPNIVAAEVIRLLKDSGLAFNVCRTIPMSSDTLVIPNEANAFTTYWAAEAGTLTDGGHATPFATNTLSAKKVIGRATASRSGR